MYRRVSAKRQKIWRIKPGIGLINVLKTRIVTAVIGIPVLLFLLYQGGIYTKALFLAVGVLGLAEYFAMLKKKQINPLYIPAYLLLLLLLLRGQAAVSTWFFVVLLLMVVIMVLKYPFYSVSDVAFSLFGPVYLGYLLSFGILLSDEEHALPFFVFSFLITWSTDVGGYVFGKKWGKTKLTPLLSPKKTWVGTFGGILMAVISAAVFHHFYAIGTSSLTYLLILTCMASIAAQFGDLFISGIKRYCEVKDSGKIIPGHGGVLDRFDSYLMVLPMVYLFLQFMVF